MRKVAQHFPMKRGLKLGLMRGLRIGQNEVAQHFPMKRGLKPYLGKPA